MLKFHRLLYGTPSLVARMYAYQGRSEAALARALGDGLPERLAAGQIIAVLRILALENWRRIDAGESADRVHPSAVRAAEQAFVQLRTGLESELESGPEPEPEPERQSEPERQPESDQRPRG